MADPQKPVLFERASAVRLSAMLKWFETQGPGATHGRPLRSPRGAARLELAVAQEAIARGASGEVKFKRGKTKGEETERAKVVEAFNRRFSSIDEDAEVFLVWKSGGWEVEAIVGADCVDLSNPAEIAGYVEGEARALILNESGCWELIELDEDCL